jgi:geranylgeranyl diphosphate synthase, type II
MRSLRAVLAVGVVARNSKLIEAFEHAALSCSPMDDNETSFRVTFWQTLSTAKQLVMNSVPNTNAGLRKLMGFALHSDTPSGYPFVLKYSFCRRERDGEKILKLAGVVHLLQQSLLITDDIFDCGELRGGNRPVYLKYDVKNAIIAAELLQSIALRCASEELVRSCFRNTEIVFKLLNLILLNCYIGQYLDIFNSARPTVTCREYYRVIALGAGRCFQDVARCGALLADKPEQEIRILGKFAYSYGMALFILDDTIDMMPASATGKTYASDLKARRMRLPIIMALRLANRSQRQLLYRFLRNKTPRIEQVATVIRDCGALQASLLVANRYLTSSLRSLAKLPPSLTTQRLRWLAERLLMLA